MNFKLEIEAATISELKAKLKALIAEEAPTVKPVPAPQPEAPQVIAETPAPTVSKADIRALAVNLSKTNKAGLIALLASVGASKLSEVPESRYNELYERLVQMNA